MSDKAVVGCFLAMVVVFVTIPAWFAILYWIISQLEAPVWVWVVYWLYLPFTIAGGLLSACLQSMVE